MDSQSTENMDAGEWKILALLSALCAAFGLCGLVINWSGLGPAWLGPVCYGLAMIFGGWDAAQDAAPKVLRGQLDIHFLMLAVAAGASFIGAFGEGALLLFLFSFAGALEHFALHRTRREIDALLRVAPKEAQRINPDTGKEEAVDVETIHIGDLLRIRPGDIFPVDAQIESGDSAADESTLTGEAQPVGKGIGDAVYSGTLNLWGAVDVRCTRPAQQSALQRIIVLIDQARQMRAPSQRFTDRFGSGYTVGVLIVTAAMFFVWWGIFNIPPFRHPGTGYSAFYRAMTLLVVASPCALVLSIPSAILAAIAWGARHGILFRGGAAIEELARIGVVAMDKTGTLTTGDLEVMAVESFPPGREQQVAEWAYTLEQKANHPIARAVVRHGEAHHYHPHATLAEFRSLTGQGVQGQMNDAPCLLGRRELFEDGDQAAVVRNVPPPTQGQAEIWLAHEDLLGRILLQDRIRPESAGVLKELTADGLRVVMLTGDRSEAAVATAALLGPIEVFAELQPEDKVAAIGKLRQGGVRVAMIGDGINDAPSLAAADVAVAMGARGSDAALEQSDVVLMDDKIENFHEAFRLSRRAGKVIRQNIAISLGTIVVMVAAAVFGLVPITIGVLAHEGSTVLVCLNSLRLLHHRRTPQAYANSRSSTSMASS